MVADGDPSIVEPRPAIVIGLVAASPSISLTMKTVPIGAIGSTILAGP